MKWIGLHFKFMDLYLLEISCEHYIQHKIDAEYKKILFMKIHVITLQQIL